MHRRSGIGSGVEYGKSGKGRGYRSSPLTLKSSYLEEPAGVASGVVAASVEVSVALASFLSLSHDFSQDDFVLSHDAARSFKRTIPVIGHRPVCIAPPATYPSNNATIPTIIKFRTFLSI